MVGHAIAESVKSDDRYQYQRRYTQPLLDAPVTGFFSLLPDRDRADPERGALRRRPTTVRHPPGRPGQQHLPKGGRVQLTIDPAAQKAAYDSLKAIPGVQGAVVAIEPSSGKVLAMVSLPSFDPNLMATHDFEALADNYDKLLHDPGSHSSTVLSRPDSHPAATFKLSTALAALEDGLYDDVDSL